MLSMSAEFSRRDHPERRCAMTYRKELSPSYLNIRGMYDARFDSPTPSAYNELSGAINNMKTSYTLPNNMYDALNTMQQNFGQQLGGLERKL
jgi:hypothetical protein